MLKTVVALAVAAAMAAPAYVSAQKADFSGTWTFDEAKSDPAGGPGGGGGGGGRGPGGGGGGGGRMGGGTPTKLTIKQTAAELTVERTLANGTETAVYKLDGSESANKTGMGESKTKAAWDGSNLVLTGKQAVSTPQGEIEIETKEIYTVTGTVLTVTTTRTTPRGENTRKLVFNKG
jgi:hypothetical protein